MNTEKNNIVWEPSKAFQQGSHLWKYILWLTENYNLQIDNYQDVYTWSVENHETFWESVWKYFNIISYAPYTNVLSGKMPNVKWFEGSKLNYVEHIFRNRKANTPAIKFSSERIKNQETTWDQLDFEVARMASFLRSKGIKKGDRIAAFLPNIPEATIAFLATASIGAIWSSCSPDFGGNSVIDRFSQIKPKLLFAVDGYQYNGKGYNKIKVVKSLETQLETVDTVVLIPYLSNSLDAEINKCILWDDIPNSEADLQFEPVDFDHPIYILYSSGTTGKPKAITHSHGGNLLEHLKYVHFHNDVHPGENYFWFSTTGWMMWNFVHATLLAGATIVLYDGSPSYPDLGALWKLTEDTSIHHFGTSAPFLTACMKSGITPGREYNLDNLRSISSTGSPLPSEAYDYVYDKVKKDVALWSMAGGTDVCTAWVGGCPLWPVRRGEIQCRALGASIESWNVNGNPLENEVGELVVTKPMPSMPVFFWGDEENKRYLKSYFGVYDGIWRHGDWIKITKHQGLIIYGRSDATLNRGGVRIGTAEIYRAMDKVRSVKDSLIVNLELEGGQDFMPMFIQLNEGIELTEVLIKEIKSTLRSECSPRHVPDKIFVCPDIPYTISGKKIESPIKKILMGQPISKAANKDAMRNPRSLNFFITFAEELEKHIT